jgi:hypothetical protein
MIEIAPAVALAGLALFGVLCGALIFERGTLSCDGATGKCTLTRRTIYGSYSQSFRLDDLQGAKLAEDAGGDESSSFKIMVLTRQGPIPLMGYSTGMFVTSMRRKVETIRSFATQRTTQNLEIRHANYVIAIIAGFFALLMGGALVAVIAIVWQQG